MKADRWQRIQDIFCTALELGPATRPRFLDNACGNDTALREEVENFLRSIEDDCDVVADAIQSEAVHVLDGAAESQTGRPVGPYRLIRRIGQGGMGAVYLAARADQEYERQVAIKLVRSESPVSSELIRRFRTERQILAGLQHPHIAQMLDGGITENGTPYLVMEYVDGIRIDQYCRAQALSVGERIKLFRSVCSAVEYAHRSLVVHRDIKPSNILVTPEGVPKLLDFGIAKILRPGRTSQTVALTRPMERLMTVEYASPEQIRGEAVTTATDVYALGIVLYELLTGQHPFEGQKGDGPALQRAICDTEARRPSVAATGFEAGFSAHLRGDLDHIALMAIRKEPSARYASVGRFSDDLGRYLEGFPVIARRGTGRYRLGKFVGRHRFGVVAAALFVSLLAALGIGMGLLAARVTRERDIARRERARSDEVSQFLTSLFGSSDPFQSDGSKLSARQVLDQGAQRIGRELQSEPEVRAKLLQTIAVAYQHLGALDRAEDLFRAEMEAEEQAFGPGAEDTGRILRELGNVERQRGKRAEAEKDLRRALAIHAKLPPGKDLELAHTLNNLSIVLQLKGDLDQAEADSRRAVAIASRYPAQTAETLTMMSNLGSVLAERGKSEEAEALLRTVLLRRRQVLGERHPQVPTSMRRLGFMLARIGRYSEAEELDREALAGFRSLLGDGHADTLSTMNNLASVLAEEGAYGEAEALYRQAIDGGTRAMGDRAEMAGWKAGLAWLLFNEGQTAAADQLFRGSLAEVHAPSGAGSVREARILARHAVVQSAMGRHRAAERQIEDALAIYRQKPGTAQVDLAEALFELAEVYRAGGRSRDAGPLYGQAVAMDRAGGSLLALQTANHLLGYAAWMESTGAAQAAEPLIREALSIRMKILPAGFWSIEAARGALGEVLTHLGRYSEAEPLVVGAYTSLSRIPGQRARESQTALRRVTALYRSEGRLAQASAYRAGRK